MASRQGATPRAAMHARIVILGVLFTLLTQCNHVSGAHVLRTPAEGCKKLLWFTAIGGAGGSEKLDIYKKYVKAAMVSAVENAPSLVPNLVYDGPNDTFVKWFTGAGGRVHNHKLSFYDKLQALVDSNEKTKAWLGMYGAFLRMDLPFIMSMANFDSKAVETEYVLYTDTDVVFQKDIDSCTFKKPNDIMLGGEFHKGKLENSGVLVINIASLRRDHKALVDWGVKNKWPGALDQPVLLGYYQDRVELLPDRYNWKPYWGPNDDAAIVHFHGPKPDKCLDCLVTANLEGLDLKSCGCPNVYTFLFKSSPDKGNYYSVVLLKWYQHLSKSMAPLKRKHKHHKRRTHKR